MPQRLTAEGLARADLRGADLAGARMPAGWST
jgi:hypothetical protein